VYSRFIPNLTRRDGSAFDRLLATRFATAGQGNAGGDTEPKSSPPTAQPPPMRPRAMTSRLALH
jgi:integrase